jgi:hypothetical protein
MANEPGRGAQVQLAGVAQAAARGAMADSLEGNGAIQRRMQAAGDPGVVEVGALALAPYAANDTAAAELGVKVGQFYRNTAGRQQRQA